MWYIYKITNQINGKIYIGQTSRKPEKRWGEHKKSASAGMTPFARAIKKYGWENFSKEVIDTAISQEEANDKEQYWIEYYKCSISTYGKNCGYNITIGGAGIQQISQIEQEEMLKLWNNKKTITQISQILERDRHAVSHILHNQGISTEEIFERQKYPFHNVYVFNLKKELIKVFSSFAETVEKNDINEKQIQKVINHHLASTHELIFLYEEDIDRLDEHIQRHKSQHRGKIKSTNMLTNEVKVYNTISDAQNKTGIDRHTIRRYIRNKTIKNNIKWEDIEE